MPEPVVVDPKEEKKEKPLGLEVREKSFQQILKEQQEERQKSSQTVEETEEQKAEKLKQEEEKKTQEAEAAKSKEEADRKLEETRQAELAQKAADAVLKKQEEEKKAEEEKVRAAEEAKKREEDLKPKFTGVDKDGKVVPKTYEEIVDEGARIGEERALARLKAEQAEEKAKKDQEDAAKTQNEETIKKQRQDAADTLQKELDADLTDLYTAGKLPKIINKDDPNDPGLKEERNLFETAQKVNADRMAKGLPVIRSLKLIYYEHYKPLGKPAGHDAPVLGAEDSKGNEAPEDKYVVSRDRNKSISQMVKEEAQRVGKKLGIRGK